MDLSGYLLAWRTTALPDREVIDALVHPAHAGTSSAFAAALKDWPGSHYWSDEPDGRHLVLTRPIGRRRRDAWAVHLLLLAATLFTTTFVGAVLLDAIPFDPNPLALLLGTYPFPRDFIHAWAKGLPFSAPLLAILLCHELGHYVTARRYQLDVSLPFFIPAPVVPWSIGTMGAFIRLRTVVSDRRQLLDVGVAGPIAGLLVALPVLVIGFALSHPAGGPASLPWQARAGFRGAQRGAGCVLEGLAPVGRARAAAVARAPRSPVGAGRASAAAAVAPRARVGCARPASRHVHADTFSTLKAGERPVKGRRRGKGPFPFPPPLTGLF